MRIERPATTNARIGATIAGTMTLPTRPPGTRASVPWAATAAPTTPPISACDELDGRPKYQVTTFHVIAPISPLKMIAGSLVTAAGSTIPPGIVAATASEMNAPAKLSSDARPIAMRGGSARVEIEVATTLAVSWNPLVKSNASPVPTTRTRRTALGTRTGPSTRVFYDVPLGDVRPPLGGVDRVLEPLVDVLPAD